MIVSTTRLIVAALLLARAAPAQNALPAERAATREWFRDARFGMFIHWGVYSQLETPTTATWADLPGAADYILTASDMNATNARMAQMNAHMRTKASENRYAYFSLDAVYGLAKPRFSVSDLLFSNAPFGTYISLDGVHPSSQGQGLLATAAAQSISLTYGVPISVP